MRCLYTNYDKRTVKRGLVRGFVLCIGECCGQVDDTDYPSCRSAMSLDVLLQAAHYVDHNDTGANGHQSTASADHTGAVIDRERGSLMKAASSNSVSCTSGHNSDDSGQMDTDSVASDESEGAKRRPTKRKSAPSVSRDKEKTKRGSIKPNTENRSVHNVLEKNRRAHLKDCFESLKHEVMETDDEKKASHLAVLKSAVRCIQQLQKQSEQLQRDHDRVLKEKTLSQQRFVDLKREVMANNPCFDVLAYLHTNDDDADSQATCTAPGSPAPLYKPLDERLSNSSQVDQSSMTLSSLKLSPSHRSAGSSSPPERSVKNSRKKPRDDSCDTLTKSRRPPIKSVTEILQETSSEPPSVSTSASPPVKSPPNVESKKILPIKLRILQDQQDGMFIDHTKTSPVLSPISPAADTHLSPSVQENYGMNGLSKIAAPFTENMAMPLINGAAYWSDHNMTAFPFYGRPGFPVSMFPMNQFLVPVTSATGGQIPHVVMMPALGNLYGQQTHAATNPPRSDSPSSS